MFGMIKMLPLLLIIGGAGFGYHKIVVNEKDNRINQQQMEIASATQQNVALQTAAQTNEKTIRNLETQMKKQAEAFSSLTKKANKLESEKQQYMKIFKKHDLTKLGRSKPELLESKMTKATSRVFRQVEEDSRELDEADDPSDELPYVTN